MFKYITQPRVINFKKEKNHIQENNVLSYEQNKNQGDIFRMSKTYL